MKAKEQGGRRGGGRLMANPNATGVILSKQIKEWGEKKE